MYILLDCSCIQLLILDCSCIQLIAVKFIISTSTAVFGLKCHNCASTKSYTRCMENVVEVECGYHEKCGKYVYTLPDSHIYKRSCTPTYYCNDADRMCEAIMQAQDCEVHCCEDELCNGNTNIGVSGVLVLACVLFALFTVKLL